MTVEDLRDLRKTILILLAIILPCLIGGIAGVIIGEGGLTMAGFSIAIPSIFALVFHAGLYLGSNSRQRGHCQ